LVVLIPATAHAQNGPVPPARVAVLQAEDRRAPTPRDVTTLRTAVRGRDTQTALLALRALGRLERPALIPDIVPALRFALPEIRAEAANAIGQAAQGWKTAGAITPSMSPASVLATLAGRLQTEEEPNVRAALCETIGRLPYRASEEVARAEGAILEFAAKAQTLTDRLGVAKGLEALIRLHRAIRQPGDRAVEMLRRLATERDADASLPGLDAVRDARIRRLAVETLTTAERLDEDLVARAAGDPDPQVRRLAMRAASMSRLAMAALTTGLQDAAPMVRYEALRGLYSTAAAKVTPTELSDDDLVCRASIGAAGDVELHVALLALDQLAACGRSSEAMALLERNVNDLSAAGSPRGWHRPAHAIVALAQAAPDRAGDALAQFVQSAIWQLRVYAARAASTLGDREALEKLVADGQDNVVEAALDGLSKVAGHDDDPLYVAALARSGYQAVRAAAIALDRTPHRDDAVRALTAAWRRLVEENRPNSSDTRAAIRATLTRLGTELPAPKPARAAASTAGVLNAADLRRLAAPRARVTIRNVGTFDLALVTTEAPATVLSFVSLVETGYYDGLTFHRVVPNFVVQGGSPAANEYVGTADYVRDEVGLWPHVRGAVGMSTRGRDTGDGQIFINLVDNPKFDHEYTVFAQVLTGVEVVDRILEGDVIEKIEILP
jgi:cyclophilin family peptidyl-prolyl cis-trans isomerase